MILGPQSGLAPQSSTVSVLLMIAIYYATMLAFVNLFFQDVPTYRRLTMEFLCKLEHTVNIYPGDNSAKERIKFQLMDRSFNMSINEWCNCFGFIYGDGHTRTSNYLLNPQPIDYCKQMSIEYNAPKGGNIEVGRAHV